MIVAVCLNQNLKNDPFVEAAIFKYKITSRLPLGCHFA